MFVDIAIGYGLLNFIASLLRLNTKRHKKLKVTTESLTNNQVIHHQWSPNVY